MLIHSLVIIFKVFFIHKNERKRFDRPQKLAANPYSHYHRPGNIELNQIPNR